MWEGVTNFLSRIHGRELVNLAGEAIEGSFLTSERQEGTIAIDHHLMRVVWPVLTSEYCQIVAYFSM